METYEIRVPFYVTASSSRMAAAKLVNALNHINVCPYRTICDRFNAGEIDKAEMERLEALVTQDDPREITGHWDWPRELYPWSGLSVSEHDASLASSEDVWAQALRLTTVCLLADAGCHPSRGRGPIIFTTNPERES